MITDFNLDSEHTGAEFVKKVRELYGARFIPVPYFFLISGDDLDNIPENSEFNQVLQKSYKFETFLQTMKDWHSTRTSIGDRALAIEDRPMC